VERKKFSYEDTYLQVLEKYSNEKNDALLAKMKTFKTLNENIGKIRIRFLCNHSAGFRHYRDSTEFLNRKHYANSVELLEVFGNDPLLFEPGKSFGYSSYGYNLLGILIEVVSGQTYEQFMRETIMTPLGLHNTFPETELEQFKNANPENPDRVCAQYWREYEDITKPYKKNVKSWMREPPNPDMRAKLPAGGMMSTAMDICQFVDHVVLGDFLSPEIKKEMFTPGYDNFGLGFRLELNKQGELFQIWHSGGAIGGGAFAMALPQHHISVGIVLNDQTFDFFEDIVMSLAEFFIGKGRCSMLVAHSE